MGGTRLPQRTGSHRAPARGRSGQGMGSVHPPLQVPGDTVSGRGSFVSVDTCVMPAAGVGASGESGILLMSKEPGRLLNLVPSMVSFLLDK